MRSNLSYKKTVRKGGIFALKNETRRRKQMVVRRGHYEKQDVVDAMKRVRNGESYAKVARASYVPLRTLFKKAKVSKGGCQ